MASRSMYRLLSVLWSDHSVSVQGMFCILSPTCYAFKKSSLATSARWLWLIWLSEYHVLAPPLKIVIYYLFLVCYDDLAYVSFPPQGFLT